MNTDLERTSFVFSEASHANADPAPQYQFPCSLSQRSCWFLDQISPGTAANNLAIRFRLLGPVKPAFIEEAVRVIINRHENLRTRFVAEQGEPRQVVEGHAPFELGLVSLRHLGEEERHAEAERLAAEEARVGFDLTRLPLLRIKLLEMDDDDYVLLLTIHHIVSDGWSIGIITDELGEIYESLVESTIPELPELEIQYADYACWQNERATNGEMQELLDGARAKLDGFRPLQIPTDSPRPAAPSSRGAIRSILLPRELTNTLQQFSNHQQCTLFVTIFSAFLVLLAQESGQTDIVVRTQTAGRDRSELEPLIGWFANSVLLRSDLSGDPTFTELVKRTNEVVLDAFDYRDLPFELLLEQVRPQQRPLRHPLSQVNFIFQRDLVRPWTRGGISLVPLPSKAAGTFVDLNFFLVERNDGWRLSVDINEDVFRLETGDYFLHAFRELLHKVALQPESRLSELERHATRQGKTYSADRQLAEEAIRAPRTQLERDLIALWQDVLQIAPLGVDSNFFDFGGHSLSAVQLLARVQERYGTQLSLARLFRDPTVAAMAQALESPDSAIDDELIKLHPSGSEVPLFIIGGDHFFRAYARHLGPEQPVFGLSLQRYEGRSEPTPFEEIGRDLAARLLAAYPSGPYRLAGWCVDGTVAYEAARALRSMNRPVEVVVLLDAINPVYRRKLASTKQTIGRAWKRLRTAASSDQPACRPSLIEELLDMSRVFGRALMPTGSRAIEQDAVIVQNDPDRQEFRRLLYIAEHSFTPAPIDVPLLLLRSDLSPHQESELGWGGLSSAGLTVREMTGGHIDMFREPHVQRLGEATVEAFRASSTVARPGQKS